ncbi:bifunctional [glutamate--ammonia ligase]-adenylyl-L-tyrosine phosphorylase/[glutamate--ammonia-ligase] adenylyltransferase [Sessilibacter sp. MAH1]
MITEQLSKHFSQLPSSLRSSSEKLLANFQERWPEHWDSAQTLFDDKNTPHFVRLIACSLYAQKIVLSDPDLLGVLLTSSGREYADNHREQLNKALLSAINVFSEKHPGLGLETRGDAKWQALSFKLTPNKAQLDELAALWDSRIRRYRQRIMVATIWREFNSLSTHQEITFNLSELASACVQVSMDLHYQLLALQHGFPVGQFTQKIQPMLVLGMGKLGAWELNLSSDIDLIYAFPEAGETAFIESKTAAVIPRLKTLSNQEFFIRLGQKIIKSLDAQTADGFVFRVDMRLRPYGQSGALVANFNALEDYYQNQGREWERYAMIKSRVIASSEHTLIDPQYSEARQRSLMNLLRPFSYRRYVDFSVINALRDLKAMINREVKLRGKTQDVKLGFGGIREVEFIAQAFQLIRGGREPQLQERRLLKVLPILSRLHHLSEQTTQALAENYLLLRRAEHGIQGWNDQQTQALPVDVPAQQALAVMMGYGTWDEFYDALQQVREQVNEEFQRVIDASGETSHQDNLTESRFWHGLVCGESNDEVLLEELSEMGFPEAESTLEHLRGFLSCQELKRMSTTARDRLDKVMGQVLHEVAKLDIAELDWALSPTQVSPVEVLKRVLPLLEAVARRSAYLILMQENPTVIKHLVRLFSASVWIAEQITRHPALLEALIDAANLHRVPEKVALTQELNQALLGIAHNDLETQMETLRYFRRAHALQVAACEVSGSLPLMKVSDYLTWVAEAILVQVLELAWQALVEKHGVPTDQNGPRADKGFVIIAYGKLGGIELAHGSDLDLVFIHDCDPQLSTDGDAPIDNQTFYTRLGKKIIHILNTRTPSGRLYEVDMRLRPSGNSGLLVSSLSAFERYQKEQAWTWEHQALLRARPVAGTESLAQGFMALRREVLCMARDSAKLRQEVVEMRDKMLSHLGSKPNQPQFDIKHDRGGIVDIEFMVQYAALAWAHQFPALVTFSDNIRILDEIEQAGLMPSRDVQLMVDAYKAYRSIGHRLALQQQPNVLPADSLLDYRQAISALWQKSVAENPET